MKLPPLKALPVFEAVARLESFSLAAEELAITQSAVSHQIKQLETYLGERLFWRSGRRVTLTDEGRQYFDAIGSALLQIERASEQLLGRESSRLRLSVFSSFAVRWLVPRLPDLQRLYPQLELSLEMSSESPVLSDRVADCFITIHKDSPAYSYELLYVERLFPVCSQDYWQKIRRELNLETVENVRITPEEVARFPRLGGLVPGSGSGHSFNSPGAAFQSYAAGAGSRPFPSGDRPDQRLYAQYAQGFGGFRAFALPRSDDRRPVLFCMEDQPAEGAGASGAASVAGG